MFAAPDGMMNKLGGRDEERQMLWINCFVSHRQASPSCGSDSVSCPDSPLGPSAQRENVHSAKGRPGVADTSEMPAPCMGLQERRLRTEVFLIPSAGGCLKRVRACCAPDLPPPLLTTSHLLLAAGVVPQGSVVLPASSPLLARKLFLYAPHAQGA